MADQARGPHFYTVPAGTPAKPCRDERCRALLFFIDSPKTKGKKIPVDCRPEITDGAIAPTKYELGQGVNHFPVCVGRDRFTKKAPPARREKPEHLEPQPRRCIFCGCTETSACQLTLEEAGLEEAHDQPAYAGELHVGCSWLQLNPPVCSAPACRDKLGELPLRMRHASAGKL